MKDPKIEILKINSSKIQVSELRDSKLVSIWTFVQVPRFDGKLQDKMKGNLKIEKSTKDPRFLL